MGVSPAELETDTEGHDQFMNEQRNEDCNGLVGLALEMSSHVCQDNPFTSSYEQLDYLNSQRNSLRY